MKPYYLPVLVLMACAVNGYAQNSNAQTVSLGVDKSKKPEKEHGPNFANRQLSNLEKTSIDVHLLPDESNKRNLGSLNHSWKNLYLTGSIYLDGKRFISNKGELNTFIGSFAGNGNTSGQSNTAVGQETLFSNTEGQHNVAIGTRALYNNINGIYNASCGAFALFSNTIGSYNSAFGGRALFSNTTGLLNTAIGNTALTANTTGSENTAVGSSALGRNVNGSYNSALGSQSLVNNINGENNTACGSFSLAFNKSGHQNTACGSFSLINNTIGNYNAAFGSHSLYNNTEGSSNTALGVFSLFSNTTGWGNTATGYNSLYSNNEGVWATAYGYESLEQNTIGYLNSAFGVRALVNNTVGNSNTAIGSHALYSNTIGGGNSAFGDAALFNNTGSLNTAVGFGALLQRLDGSNNTGIGTNAGNMIEPSSCTMLGARTSGNAFLTNATAIGYNAFVFEGNQVVVGNTFVSSIGGYANWSNFSDGRYKSNIKEDVPGLNFITQLRPVTYTLNIDGIEQTIKAAIPEVNSVLEIPSLNGLKPPPTISRDKVKSEPTEQELKGRQDKAKVVYTGFVAQEVEKLAKEINYDFSGVDAPVSENGFYSLRYGDFVVPLVKAVQELNKKNEELEQRIQKLEALLSNNEESFLNNKTDKKSNETVYLSSARLEQNSPNPSKTSTIIRYFLPDEVSSASVVISDMKGKIIKTISLKTKGSGQININTALLTSGTYSYSLLIDGKQIDTRRMTIAR
jgi:hypothetical protein